MSERSDLLVSISETIEDYRAGEIAQPTPEHVDRWICQFAKSVQVPLLREIDHVFQKTYFSKSFFSKFLAKEIGNTKLLGDKPCDFWRVANVFNIQQQGHSQTEIRDLFAEALKKQCHLEIDKCGSTREEFIYLDDVLFTGGRIGTDLSAWITNEAPAKATVHILVVAIHRFGKWKCSKRLEKDAVAAGKELKFNFWPVIQLENRRNNRNVSEVLWPVTIPEDAALQAYIAQEHKFPFEPRQPGGKLTNAIFSSEEGRQLIERELLLAGMRIRSFSQNPSPILRPLGFSPFGLGFGSMIVTYRNCPNNTPLALWWGDPDADQGHPFSQWYPLLPRKTYTQGGNFDDSDF